VRLAGKLSPENLYCDGECSQAEANRRYKQIMREWHKLEKKAGKKMTEDEAWAWYIKKHKLGDD
jgi:hypothetical protein